MFRVRTSIVMDRPADPDVAEILNMVITCQTLHILPQAGALFDQDSYHVWLMEVVMSWQTERQKIENQRASSGAKHA